MILGKEKCLFGSLAIQSVGQLRDPSVTNRAISAIPYSRLLAACMTVGETGTYLARSCSQCVSVSVCVCVCVCACVRSLRAFSCSRNTIGVLRASCYQRLQIGLFCRNASARIIVVTDWHANYGRVSQWAALSLNSTEAVSS